MIRGTVVIVSDGNTAYNLEMLNHCIHCKTKKMVKVFLYNQLSYAVLNVIYGSIM